MVLLLQRVNLNSREDVPIKHALVVDAFHPERVDGVDVLFVCPLREWCAA